MLRHFAYLVILFGVIGMADTGVSHDEQYFESAGVLFTGVECILFRADIGGVYLLDNYGNFEVGDRVRVRGIFDPFCVTICMQGNGCIRNCTITTADLTPNDISTWGKIKALYN